MQEWSAHRRAACWEALVLALGEGFAFHPQVWQWIKHGATLQPSGVPLTREGFEAALREELAALRKQVPPL